jgi:predicted RND superfamily exporter protein
MFTGNMPIVVDAQQVLLRELIVSYLTAFAIIAVVIMIAVRSVPAGLVAMIPNLFPTVVLFGTMGWLDRPLDIGAMMTASVALGIAVDDTLHLLLWYRRELSAHKPASAAVTSALRHCGRAMTHTTLICGCGMLVFTLSDFQPTRQFALMMFLLLAAALVGDLFLLPALLVGPCRRLFQRSLRSERDECTVQEAAQQ